MLEIQQLESWLWDAACAIRGPVDAPRFKDYILPLVFLKRLSDVFDDELEQLTEEYGGREAAACTVEQEHRLVRFYIPPEAHWDSIRRVTTGLGQHLTDAMRAVARENPKLQGVIDTVDFNATARLSAFADNPCGACLRDLVGEGRPPAAGPRRVTRNSYGESAEWTKRCCAFPAYLSRRLKRSAAGTTSDGSRSLARPGAGILDRKATLTSWWNLSRVRALAFWHSAACSANWRNFSGAPLTWCRAPASSPAFGRTS